MLSVLVGGMKTIANHIRFRADYKLPPYFPLQLWLKALETSSTSQLRQRGYARLTIRKKTRSIVVHKQEAFALRFTSLLDMHPATAKWYDRRDSVFIEFCVADSKDVKVNFDKTKCAFSCLGGTDNVKHENEIDLFDAIDENESKHKRTDRSVLCYLRKAQPGKAWPRLTKEKAKLSWLSVDFNNWKDWEDDSDEEIGNFDQFSDMMNNMGGEDDLPDLDGADDDESADSDDEKMPDLE
ncbi:hypothetical protein Q8A73_013793 [Channa argus]|nr:hypothetical protein Q8A73_013793 [Channa argus]